MKLDTYIATEQPETCRKCGSRTEIERCFERQRKEIHVCPNCKYRYELVWDDEDFMDYLDDEDLDKEYKNEEE